MIGSLILVVCFLAAYLFYEHRRLSLRGLNVPPGKKAVPMVEGCLPIVGHGLVFPKDILGFLRKASEKYGKVFRIKLFKTEYVMVCDRTLAQEYFSQHESKFSLNDVLSRLYFDYGFNDSPPSNVPQTVAINRKSLGVKYETYLPKMVTEAEAMVERMKKECVQGSWTTDLGMIMKRFIANTSSRCLLNCELTDQAFEDLESFVHIFNKCLVFSSFVPKNLVYFLTHQSLKTRRKPLIDFFAPFVQIYQKDSNQRESPFIRAAADHIDEKTGKPLTDVDICGIILTLLYVSSENTSAGLTNTITDLACHTDIWKEVKADCTGFISKGDYRGLMTSPLLNACILESSRRSPAIFQITRDPRIKDVVLGDYFIGDTNCVSLCSPLLMCDKYASEIYSNPENYNPKRFIGEKPQPSSMYDILSWGGGAHLCPGKVFALCETKLAIALILVNFDINVNADDLPPLALLSSSLYAERKVQATINITKN